MGLLFLIAGYFTPRAYDRKGAGPFLIDRLKRLGIPLLFYEVVILPMISYPLDLHAGFQGIAGAMAGRLCSGAAKFCGWPRVVSGASC